MVYGLTAAHVLPSGAGTQVTFPACREISLRMKLISRYTSVASFTPGSLSTSQRTHKNKKQRNSSGGTPTESTQMESPSRLTG